MQNFRNVICARKQVPESTKASGSVSTCMKYMKSTVKVLNIQYINKILKDTGRKSSNSL